MKEKHISKINSLCVNKINSHEKKRAVKIICKSYCLKKIQEEILNNNKKEKKEKEIIIALKLITIN